MKRNLVMDAASADRSLWVLMPSVMVFAVLTATNVGISSSEALATMNAGHGDARQLFYTASGVGPVGPVGRHPDA
jgi:hypothetical protein